MWVEEEEEILSMGSGTTVVLQVSMAKFGDAGETEAAGGGFACGAVLLLGVSPCLQVMLLPKEGG